MRSLWYWFLDRGTKARIALVVLYTWAIFMAGVGLALVDANGDRAAGHGVPEAYRIGVQEATRYLNSGRLDADMPQSAWCDRVAAWGMAAAFQQSSEYQEAYESGCEGVWDDFNT